MFIGCSSQKNKAPPVVHLHVLKGSHKAKDFSVDCPDGGFLTISPLPRKHKSPQAQPRNAKNINTPSGIYIMIATGDYGPQSAL